MLIRSTKTFQCNPHFLNYLYQSFAQSKSSKANVQSDFDEKHYLHLAEVKISPKFTGESVCHLQLINYYLVDYLCNELLTF